MYHFTSSVLRSGRAVPPIGEWLDYTGSWIPWGSALRANKHPMKALYGAKGNFLHVVVLKGETQKQIWGHYARHRKIIATIDATELLREFARWCAIQVVGRWSAPAIVREYLETGNESLYKEAKRLVMSKQGCCMSEAAWAEQASMAALWPASKAAEAADWAVRFVAESVSVGSGEKEGEGSPAGRAMWVALTEKFQQMVDKAFDDQCSLTTRGTSNET